MISRPNGRKIFPARYDTVCIEVNRVERIFRFINKHRSCIDPIHPYVPANLRAELVVQQARIEMIRHEKIGEHDRRCAYPKDSPLKTFTDHQVEPDAGT